jgi:hypothetical protein
MDRNAGVEQRGGVDAPQIVKPRATEANGFGPPGKCFTPTSPQETVESIIPARKIED